MGERTRWVEEVSRWSWLLIIGISAYLCAGWDARGWMAPTMAAAVSALYSWVSVKRTLADSVTLTLGFGLPAVYGASLGYPYQIGVWAILGFLAALAGLAWFLKERQDLPHVGVIALVLTVVYFSGNAGGASPMRAFLEGLGLGPEAVDATLFAIRKTVHFGFYAVLAGLAWTYAKGQDHGARARWIYGLGVALAVAAFDEGRQFGLGNRSGQVADVILDLVGAITSIAVCERWLRKSNGVAR